MNGIAAAAPLVAATIIAALLAGNAVALKKEKHHAA